MGWELIAYTVLRRSSSPSGGTAGTVTITFPPVPVGQVWRVDGIAVVCDSSTTAELLIYDEEPTPTSIPCQGTRNANFTVDDQASPLTIPGGNQLVLVFVNVSKGAVARARVQFSVLQGTAGKAQPVAV